MTQQKFTRQEKQFLLRVARDTINNVVRDGRRPSLPADLPERLREVRGAFVTLNQGHHLRGCIGTFRGDRPLVETVQEMAVAAAMHDPRFPQVTQGETERLTVEISALTPLEPVEDVNTIEVGTHGLYITKGMQSGVLLPQVATEQGWDREQFLSHTCLKAGLPTDAWKTGATIERFSAEVFSEDDV